ncbi:unnamed protein product [Cladocopium goreaui]|uniref:Uncharacterized protein n=1 Tax=Cladocopium goreaui TaxID=2562237 RepID=A0A9P1CV35_9DINO|nr:unnamed protein product [Cladocopium goreaui]
MVCFTPFLYIVTREPLAETQTFRVLMDQLVLALTYLILLKCAHVRLPPICASWSEVTSEDLWDLHHVLALHMHGDVLAEEVSVAIRAAYDWHQLRQSGKVLSEMWFRVVRKQVPLPHALLTAIHVLEKRLAVPRLPCFPDGHALPWFTQCTTALRELVPSSMFSTTHALPLRISGEATSGLVETDASPSVAPASECPLAMHMLPDEGMDSSVDEAEEDLSDVNGDESPRHLQQKLELHSSTERDLNRFRILHRDFQQDRANGIDDGLSVDIPLWARKILDREAASSLQLRHHLSDGRERRGAAQSSVNAEKIEEYVAVATAAWTADSQEVAVKMPLNKGKSCRLCGSTKHTLATCCCRGAPEFRKLLKANQCKAKSKQSRTCRGTGTAAARKRGAKPAKKVAVSSRKRQAIARANYSGDKKTFDQRHDRQGSGGSVCSKPEKALEELQSLGFVNRPGLCSSCGVGQLLGPVPRHDAGSEGSLYYRCSNWECKKYTNCLSLQTWLCGLGRFGLLTPVRLLGIIKVYATRKYPRPQNAWPLACENYKVVRLVMDRLRHLEAEAGLRMCKEESWKLRGSVEADVHPREKPKHLLLYWRWGGLVERGQGGKIVLAELPHKLVSGKQQ